MKFKYTDTAPFLSHNDIVLGKSYKIKPLTITRYADDIFLVDELRTVDASYGGRIALYHKGVCKSTGWISIKDCREAGFLVSLVNRTRVLREIPL